MTKSISDILLKVPWRASTYLVLILLGLAADARSAMAHPHVWATMRIELVYDPGGFVTGLRHSWQFDEMFSAFATSGLEARDGVLSSTRLAPLAERYVSSLKPYGYFTRLIANGATASFDDPAVYRLEHENGVLTLHFTLPLKAPIKAMSLELKVYDPVYFVDLSLTERDSVRLVDAPASCRFSIVDGGRPKAVDESFFNALSAQSDWAAAFATTVEVSCP